MKKVSIITTCYNQSNYISDAIESVLCQTYDDWEMIIVDDASTDNSVDVVQQYAKQDTRIKLIQLSTNSGSPIVPRNKALETATGEYILPLDADDKIERTCLEKMVATIEMGVADVICCGVEYFGDKTGKMDLPEPTPINLYRFNCLVNCSLFRKSDYIQCGNYDINCASGWEDWDFWLNFADKGKTFYRIPDTLFFYRIKQNTRNSIDKETEKRLFSYIYSKHPMPEQYKKTFSIFQKINLFFIHLLCPRRVYDRIKSKYMANRYPHVKEPKVIMTLLVHNEADIVRENLEFHHAMGVDGFIVTDNNSTDNTRKILEKYKKLGWILEIIDEPAQDYSQGDWVHRMVTLAKNKYGADWIINSDADEFWHPKSGDIKKELSEYSCGIIYIPIFNMHDNGGHWLDNTNMIVKPLGEQMQEKLIKDNKLSKFHQFSRQIPKCIVRASAYIHIHEGNHNADTVYKEPRILSSEIKIYHYNSRGLEHFKRKIMNGGAAFERNNKLGRDVGVHIRYFYEGIKNGTLIVEQEFEKNIGKYCLEECNKLMVPDTFVHDFFYLRDIEKKFPKIMGFSEMLEKIKSGASIARFGDGEFDIGLQRNKNDPYQKPSDRLSENLMKILHTPSNDKLIVCIPPFNAAHNNIFNFRDGLSFWQWYWRERWEMLSPLFVNKEYGNAFFSRESVFYELALDDLKGIWQNRNVCFVVPENGRFEYDDRLFDNIKNKTEINVPATHAFDEYDRILQQCKQQSTDTLFFIAAGPTATVLTYDLSQAGYQALDMGHFTNSYRQYLGEAKQPEAYPMKRGK